MIQSNIKIIDTAQTHPLNNMEIRQHDQNTFSFFELEIIWKFNLWTKNKHTLNKNLRKSISLTKLWESTISLPHKTLYII